MFSQVSSVGALDTITYDDDYYINIKRRKYIALLVMLGVADANRLHSTMQYVVSKIVDFYKRLKLRGLKGISVSHPGGPCVPGEKKVFVDWNGFLYPCEKIPETEDFIIGSLKKGFDIKKIQSLINVGKLTEKECLGCWAFTYCTTCVVQMLDKGRISRDARLRRCREVKAALLSTFKDIETLKYYGYAFDYE